MEIIYFKTLPSTQLYLIKRVTNGDISLPVAIIANEQTDGIGSRDNSWEGGAGNLFFSMAIPLNKLPNDLPLNSASIYFSFIMKEVLKEYTEDIWLKWPNDLYQNSSKIGGITTKKINDILVCGIGVNLKKNLNSFDSLNIGIEPILLLKKYILSLSKYPSWKQIFIQYKIEFERSRDYFSNIDREYKSLKKAILSEDGSLIIDNKKVYGLR